MKKTNVEEDVLKEDCFVMGEYTEFLRKYLKEYRNVTKIVFKITGRIYKAVKNGATNEQIDDYIVELRRAVQKKNNC